MKLRVYELDGIHRGSFLTLDQVFNAPHWRGEPHRDFDDYLCALCRRESQLSDCSWYRVTLSRYPDITGTRECDDQVDYRSEARRLTPAEAARWLKRHDHPIPPDLRALLKQSGLDSQDESCEQAELKPLSPAKQELWGFLEFRTATAKEMASKFLGHPRHASAMRKRIESIRKTRRLIAFHKSLGCYYRPDAPPPEWSA